MIIEIISSFVGAFAGAGVATYLVASRLPAASSKNASSTIPQSKLEKDPRYKTAQAMFKHADDIFKEAAFNAKEGYTATASEMRKEGDKILKRGTQLLDEIKADQGNYAPENFAQEAPYPTQGYGV